MSEMIYTVEVLIGGLWHRSAELRNKKDVENILRDFSDNKVAVIETDTSGGKTFGFSTPFTSDEWRNKTKGDCDK